MKSFLDSVEQWNQTGCAFPQDKTIHALFEEQVNRSPFAPAIYYENELLTYIQFNTLANQLAHLIKATCSIAPDTLIAVCLERSEKMFVTLMAILKAGAAYVPLDPEHPDERLEYILADTQARLVITTHQYAARLQALMQKGVQLIVLDHPVVEQTLRLQATINPVSESRSHHLAYVLYTSGTTGRPKGVMIEHAGIVNRIVWMNREYPLKVEDRILQKTPYVFDVSVWELFWAHWYGSSVVVAKPGGHQDPDYLIDLIERMKVTTVHFVPSMLSLFLKCIEKHHIKDNRSPLFNLHTLFCSGEALLLAQVRKCHALLPHLALHNLYGPTEASVDALFYNCSSHKIESVYIGRPIQNMRAYILDANLQLVPAGSTGELYLGGIGLARGYWRNPVLTSEKFVSNPFQHKFENDRLYRTGDLARWMPDGNIEYLGRNDFQIKLRGYRIELAEIEAILEKFPGISQRAVLVEQHQINDQINTSATLVAYYAADKEIDSQILISFMSQKLPDYMLPSQFIQLDVFPLTSNGKVDRAALPRLGTQRNRFEEAKTTLQKSVCVIWEECFGLSKGSIGLLDDFFHLGGDSIIGLQILGRIRQQWQIPVTMKEIFKQRTVEALSSWIEARHVPGKLPLANSSKNQKTEIFPANSLQQGFIAHYLRQGKVDDAYLVQIVWEYRTAIDVEALRQAWLQAQRCFGCLRMRFSWQQELLQIIDKEGELDWRYIDLSAELSAEVQEIKIDKILHADRDERFQLDRNSLFRVYLIKLHSESFRLIFTHHHAIMDGWSVINLCDALHAHYLGDTPLVSDTTYEQTQIYLAGLRAKQKEFWESTLEQVGEKRALTGLLKEPMAGGNRLIHKQVELSLEISGEPYKKLRAWAEREGFTLNAILQYAWHKALSVYSYSAQTIVGTTVSGRDFSVEGITQGVGLFINTLPLIVDHEKDQLLTDAIRMIQDQLHLIASQSAVDLSSLQKEGEQLFDTLLVFENFAYLNQHARRDSLKMRFREVREKLDYPLVLIAYEADQKLVARLMYAEELFFKVQLQAFMDLFKRLLLQIAACPEQSIAKLLLVEPEVVPMLKSFSASSYNLANLFEDKAFQFSEKIALIEQERNLSYGELNAQANRVAICLREQFNIKPNDLVALIFERSIEMLVAILAVIKAGGAYVPIDPKYPAERIEYLLDDSRSKLFLTTHNVLASLPQIATSAASLCIDADFTRFSSANLLSVVNDNHLAYVIYTSGTTGKPKAVLQTHHNLLRLFSSTQEWFNFSEQDVWSLFHSYTFDFSIWEIWGAWAWGGTLVIPSEEEVKDPRKFYNLTIKFGLTVLNQTPTAFYGFLEAALQDQFPSPLRYVIFGGEMLHLALLEPWIAVYGDASPQLINMYGITETTIHVTYKRLLKEHLLNRRSPIGMPIPDMQAYLLDFHGQLLPQGAVGELFIGGEGLSLGYLNQPNLTAERFLVNRFQTEKEKQLDINQRLYRTGDLAYKDSQGELFYVGRIDAQVKVRGFRIELAEIESCLLRHPSIQQAVVLCLEMSISSNAPQEVNKQLVAFYVAKQGLVTERPQEEIFTFLKSHLPHYMQPHRIVPIEQIPLTLNGKIDRRALVQLDRFSPFPKTPMTYWESELCQVWSQLLQMDAGHIAVEDRFFHLGGDSIMAIRLVNAIQRRFKSQISVHEVYQDDALGKMALLLQKNDAKSNLLLDYQPFSLGCDVELAASLCSSVEDAYPASYLQNGMLLEASLTSDGTYHDVFCYLVKSPFDEVKFRSIWQQLMHLHPLLRASFHLNGIEGWLVAIHAQACINIKIFNACDLSDIVEEERATPFHLNEPGLFRLLINNRQYEFELILSFHHAVADGWSIATLLNNFVQAYCLDSNLPYVQTLSYGQFVKAEQLIINDNQQIAFWKEFLNSWTPTKLALKFDEQCSINGLFTHTIQFDKQQSQKLLRRAKELHVQIEIFFLYAYLHTIAFYGNCDEVSLGIVTHNRLEFDGGDQLIGLFLNAIPLRFNVRSAKSFHEELQELASLRHTLRKYQRVPFGYLHTALKVELFDFIFNYVHFHILDKSRPFIESVYEFEKTNIPFSLTVQQDEEHAFTVIATAHDRYISASILEQFLHFFEQFVLAYEKEPVKTWADVTAQLTGSRSVVKGALRTFSTDKTLYDLFEEQVRRDPHKLALVDQNGSITYGALNDQASQLAYALLSLGKIEADTIVAICIERSIQAIVGILAILKSGAAYLPLDLAYPDQRMQTILNHAKTKLLLIDNTQSARFDALQLEMTKVVSMEALKFDQQEGSYSTISSNSSHLAYIIYTSGTTGLPQGVAVEHRSIINSIYAAIEHRAINTDSLVAQSASLAFDSSLLEIFPALLTGATLHLLPDDVRKDIYLLHDYCKKFMLTHLFLTTQVGIEFLQLDSSALNLLRLIVAGEKLPAISPPPDYCVINEYGPTECAVAVTVFELKDRLSDVPIGTPLPNMCCYVLDDRGQPMPIGAIGELHVAGIGVARGYLYNRQLTKLKFKLNHFQTAEQRNLGIYDSLYNTGDLVRLLPNGQLDFVGRSDFQIKLRGYRVDPSEIESSLLRHPLVKQAFVIAKKAENSGKTIRLIGYYILDSSEQIGEQDLLSYLQQFLPEYMLPARLIQLAVLPLTVNGKVDRSALPDVDLSAHQHLPPRTIFEKQVVAILAEIISVPSCNIGIDDDFFSLGGDSIVALRWAGRLRQRLGLQINVKDIFHYRTIKNLFDSFQSKQMDGLRSYNTFDYIDQGKDTVSADLIKNGEVQALFPANSLQQGFIVHFLRQGDQDDAYIVQTRIDYHTTINVEDFEKAWRHTQKQCASLRLGFDWSEHLLQVVYSEVSLKFSFFDWSQVEGQEEHIARLVQKDRATPYHLNKAGLFRIYLIKIDDKHFCALLSYHHAILDGWSSGNLLNLVHSSYLSLIGFQSPADLRLDPYLVGQNYLQKQRDLHQRYWLEQLALPHVRLDLGRFMRNEAQVIGIEEYRKVERQVEKNLAIGFFQYAQIKIMINAHGITLTSLLYYVWHKTLSFYGHAKRTTVGLVVSGRDLPIEGIEEAIGLFINTLPITVNHEKLNELSLAQALHLVQTSIQTAQENCGANLASLQKSSERLFETLFVFENYPFSSEIMLDQHLQATVQPLYEKSDYPLVMIVSEKNKSLHLSLRYAEELFEEEKIVELLTSCQELLLAIAEQPLRLVKTLENLVNLSYEWVAPFSSATESDAMRLKVEPRNQTEQNIRSIFAEVLGIETGQISVDQSFFSLGGDSILTIQLVGKLRQKLGLNIYVKDIFDLKSVAQISTQIHGIEESSPVNASITEQGLLQGDIIPLPIQKWFFDQKFSALHHWNQSFLIQTPELDLVQLQAAFLKCWYQHDAFRMRAKRDKNNFVLYYDNQASAFKIEAIDISNSTVGKSDDEVQQLFNARQSCFNLEHGPTCALVYLHGFEDGSSRLFFAMHHLFIDAVSWRILTEDLYQAYHGINLGPKGSSYRQWNYAVNEYASLHSNEITFWKPILAVLPPLWKKSLQLQKRQICLSHIETRLLLRDCSKAYNTEINHLLLTALGYALTQVTGQSCNAVLLEGHGREDISPQLDISRTLGWFTTMYPVRLDISEDLGATIKHIKEELRSIPHHGIGFGALYGYNQKNLPPITFNYLGQFDKDHADSVDASQWRIIQENVGLTVDPANQTSSLVTVTGIVLAGRLEFVVESYLQDELTDQLVSTFNCKLIEVIEHCSQRATVEYTPSDFLMVENLADLKSLPLYPAPEKHAWFPMTEVQKAYLLGRLPIYEIGNVSNHTYSEYHYDKIEVDCLEKAINCLINQQPTLRTIFSKEALMQRFLSLEEINPYKIVIHDFEQVVFSDEALESIRERLSHKIYDAENFPLFAFEISCFHDRMVLHFSLDLILLDAESRRMLLHQLDLLYRNPNYLPMLPTITFQDYQNYFQGLKFSAWYERDKSYWQNKLSKMPSRPEMPFLVSPEKVVQPRFAEHTLFVEPTVWNKFKGRLLEANISYSSALLALYGKVIGYFAGSSEFLITMTLFNRYPLHPDVDLIWGDFTSTNLFHFCDYPLDLAATLRRNHQVMWDDVEHALYTGLEVQRDLVQARRLDVNKAVSPIVFTGVVGNRSTPQATRPFLSDYEMVLSRYNSGQTSQAWIDLQAIEIGDQFMSKWLYVEQLFDSSLIAKMNQLYCRWIESIAQNGFKNLDQEQLLPLDDSRLIEQANSAFQPFSEGTLLTRFYHVAKTAPEDLIAVAEGLTNTYSYRQLLQDSQRVAQALCLQIPEEQDNAFPVAILIEKGYLQVVSLLAVLMAGYSFLPLNTDWPPGRIDEILHQAGCSLILLSRRQIEEKSWQDRAGSFLIVEDLFSISPRENCKNLPSISPDKIAYVIYTSGSTGKPKGVAISHRSAVNTIDAVNQRFQVGTADAVLAISELSFDLSIYDTFGMLSAGGKIVFPHPDRCRQPRHWLDLLTHYRVTVWNTVPQLAELLIEAACPEENLALNSLRLILLSGDWIPLTLAQRILDQAKPAELISLGGATEGSIWSIWYKVEVVQSSWKSIPYGVAMPNQKMYILNANLQMVPIGTVGMIFIGGQGVAQGYWQEPVLTQTQFIEHPALGRLYMTGDLGRWSSKGYIEFLGRKDQQVKLNGFRIELEEINLKLITISGIKQAVSHVQKVASGDQLVAYIVLDTQADSLKYLNEVNLKANIEIQLANLLPDYMLPAQYMRLEELPLTENGKLDRTRLPPVITYSNSSKVKPYSDLERSICCIWAEELKLPADVVGIYDDFFRLGGNSISAIRVMHRLHVELGLSSIEPYLYTISTVAGLVERLPELQGEGISLPKTPFQINGAFYPLSYGQERLWFIDRYTNGSSAYHIPIYLKLKNQGNVERIKLALAKIYARHETLHTILVENDEGVPSQYLLDPEEHPLKVVEKSFLTSEELELELAKDFQTPFDLQRDPPIRASLYKQASSCYLSVILHHIAADGWSISLFLRELEALSQNMNASFPEQTTSYRDFANWQRYYLNSDKLAELFLFWQKRLDGCPSMTLPVNKPRPMEFDYQGRSLPLQLDENTSQALRHLAQELQVSLYSLLLSAFFLCLKCFTAQSDLIIGTPVMGRLSHQLANLIGFFVNTVVLRVKVDDRESIFEFIKKVACEVVQVQLHQDLPFEKLVERLQVERDPSRHPLFQISFAMQNISGELVATDSCSSFEIYHLQKDLEQTALFDLSLYMDDSLPSIRGSFNYALSLFDASTIQVINETYLYLLEQLAELSYKNSEAILSKVQDLRWVSDAAFTQMQQAMHHKTDGFGLNCSLKSLFEQKAAQYPDLIAINYAGAALSYDLLNQKANQLAWFLKEQRGVAENSYVGIMLDRSDQQLIALLAVVKTQAAFIPIDISYPEERIRLMLCQVQVSAILLSKDLMHKLAECIPIDHCVFIDDLYQKNMIEQQPLTNLVINCNPDRLAYVIFTSGSTGMPKGVMIEEHSLLNYIFNVYDQRLIQLGDRVDYSTSFGFDLSLTTTIAALCLGAQVVIYPSKLHDIELYINHLKRHQVQVIKHVPAYFDLLLDGSLPNELKVVILGGEKLSLALSTRIESYFSHANWTNQMRVLDEYGPTEATVGTSISVVYPDRNMTIGKPYKNCNTYLLDEHLRPKPFQAIAELYIGGEGVARGYCENPDKTAASFIFNPYQSDEEKQKGVNRRLYQTGDLVLCRTDGNLEYIGRADRQVKLHGYRIELDEIQHVIASYPGIKQCAVVCVKSEFLCAFYSINQDDLSAYTSVEALSIYLRSKLPFFMVPSRWICLPELPLNSHGKVDLAALLTLSSNELPLFIESPHNEVEQHLCRLFAEILQLPIDQLGRQDDFFRKGGSSLAAIRLVNQINVQFGSQLRVVDLFLFPTVQYLAPKVFQGRGKYQSLVKLNQATTMPLLFMVHPGASGCEVYSSLAHNLSSIFFCYGIEYFNLYHSEKIDSLSRLAHYYLNEFQPLMLQADQKEYYLLGWSLGGKIALEIAALLESAGHKCIKVYLLDTILYDAQIESIRKSSDYIQTEQAYRQAKMSAGYSAEYIEKIMTTLPSEDVLGSASLSHRLRHTKIVLFKAMAPWNAPGALPELNTHILSLSYNNLERAVYDISQITLVELQKHHHGNILNAESLLRDHMKDL